MDFINVLPDVLQYIVPGYLAVCIIRPATQKRFSTASIWIWSGVISFVTLSLVNMLAPSLTIWASCLVCALIDIAFGVILSLAYNSKYFRKATLNLFAITPVDSTLSDVVDWENGSYVEVYLKSEDCSIGGHIKTVDDGISDGWLCLSCPTKRDLDGNVLDGFQYEGDPKIYLTIPLSDIKYMQIVNMEEE